MGRAGLPHRIEVHAGADRCFMLPGTPIFQQRTSARCWERTFELFDRNLRTAQREASPGTPA